jgi:hypothetical protein
VRLLFHFVHRQLALQYRKEACCFDLDQGFFSFFYFIFLFEDGKNSDNARNSQRRGY